MITKSVRGAGTTSVTSVEAQIKAWVQKGDAAVAELLPLHAPLVKLPGSTAFQRRSLMSLSTACLSSTGSALVLVDAQRLWDAELVMRAVMEGTLKFAYILEDRDQFQERCNEYSDVLPAMSVLKSHAKAEELLGAVEDRNADKWESIRELLRPQSELDEIRQISARKKRAVESRWGFTALVDAISKPGKAFGPTARGMLHSYAVASYLQHMSFEGVSMPIERDIRSQDRKNSIKLAHAARLISDCFSFAFLRVGIISKFCAISPAALDAVRKKYEPLFAEFDNAAKVWGEIEYPKM